MEHLGLSTRTAQAPSPDTDRFEELFKAGLFDSVRRTLTNEVEADDRMAEGVAHAWREYRRRAERGQDTDPALLKHICRQRAQAIGRRIVCDRTWRCRDAYDARAYRDGHVALLRFTGLADDRDDDQEQTLVEASMQRRQDPEDWLISALDLEAWIADLTPEDRGLIFNRMSGSTLSEIATELHVDTSTACKHIHRLGLDLAERAGVEIRKSNRGRKPKKQ